MNTKCKRAFTLLADERRSERLSRCEQIEEHGFALLLQFAAIEACLKICRYWEKPTEGWPDEIKLHANWRILRDLKSLDVNSYNVLIGPNGNSLRALRNLIAHEGANLEIQRYGELVQIAQWGLKHLLARLPTALAITGKLKRNRENLKDE